MKNPRQHHIYKNVLFRPPPLRNPLRLNKSLRNGVKPYTHMQTHPRRHGTRNADLRIMNATMQSKVRHIVMREFYRRGRMTWDMKMALRSIFGGH